MIVLKFGGTSVGSAENIRKVATIVNSISEPKIVVLSAVSGTTNALVNINNLVIAGNEVETKQAIDVLALSYHKLIGELFTSEFYELKALTFIRNRFDHIRSLVTSTTNNKEILAQGEIISTNLFCLYQEEIKSEAPLINALDFMRINQYGEPDNNYIKETLGQILAKNSNNTYVTQGYICRNHLKAIDNLKRGGSDYTASLIGAAINANEIQIWTDISGMHNNDPRYVENTYAIDEISFDEAAELAYFGAKILHPQSVIPAKENNIPVLLKNTFRPNDKGTIITNCKTPENNVRAIAAKDGITAIKIKSYRMLLAYGFLKRVFEVFEKHETPIDMITTSEVAVSLTIDNNSRLNTIVEELKEFGSVEVDTNMSIVCLAGDFSEQSKGVSAKVLNCLTDISLRMISYGGSNYNMSLLIDTDDKVEALQKLNHGVFANSEPVLV